jgi:tRNA-dihydrouridine synthase A
MITTGALLHGPCERLLAHDNSEHPVALQLGGHDPVALALAARMGEDAGYDEINLNVGCPSDRVQNNRIGACLMAEPVLVAEAVAAMQAAVRVPVTVKCRIGIDEQDAEADFQHFVETVMAGGCRVFIVHARKAWLSGLSPAQNRTVPPLDYDRVYRLKTAFPELTICINGGIDSLADSRVHLQRVDGVMLGRALDHNPWLLHIVDQEVFGDVPVATDRLSVLEEYRLYMEAQMAMGVPFHVMARHVLGLFRGARGGARFRRIISEKGHGVQEDTRVLAEAMRYMAGMQQAGDLGA